MRRLILAFTALAITAQAKVLPIPDVGEIRYEGKIFRLDDPQYSHFGDNVICDYRWLDAPGLAVSISHQPDKCHGAVCLIRSVAISSDKPLASDLTVSLQCWTNTLAADTWLPVIDGTGRELGTNAGAAFRLAGALPGSGTPLSIPMVSLPVPNKKERYLIATDPEFSTLFRSNVVEWTYPAKPGLELGFETRTVVSGVVPGSIDNSLDAFFRLALPNIKPGPAWLHDIAMVDYDYMSDGGQGWFRDIDALSAALTKSDRRKVLLVCHGWYDFLGRYCFDVETGKFDQRWTVFSNYDAAQKAPEWGSIGGARVHVGFANCKPLKMSMTEVHARLKYARSRGFRVGLYFADGMNAGDGLPGFDPDCVLEWGGWPGADVQGHSYVQNPLHPKVQKFYHEYMKALLNEFGHDVDLLNWDETFHIPAGQLGNAAAPGYADRATMLLTRDLTLQVQDYNSAHHGQIAFLTSDCLGAAYGAKDKAPYALMAHGTYQDSWCQPKAWSCGIFPNYRNVLWSVCWWPITKWSWIDFGVRNYQAAVSFSNGWGDDTGFAEMTPAQRARVLELFNWRKKEKTHLHWFAELPPAPR